MTRVDPQKWIDASAGTEGDILVIRSGAFALENGSDAANAYDTFRFNLSGPINTGTDVDGAWVTRQAGIIDGVIMWRGTGGSGGSVIADVHLNGTTIFTTQANRPEINATDGDGFVVSVTPDVTTFNANQVFTMDIDQVESGSSKELTVMVRVRYT